MATANLSKLNIFTCLIVITCGLAQTDNVSHDKRNEESSQNLYSLLPQTYYVPETYQVKQSVKYSSPASNQIPVSIVSTPKPLLPSTYKEVSSDTSKYISSQAAKQPYVIYNTHANYPYANSLTKAVTPTTATYITVTKSGNSLHEEVPKQYQYGYRVNNPHTATEFGHSEVNDGHSARGYYHVLLPDGRLQNVKYWAGPSGYHATITYESKF